MPAIWQDLALQFVREFARGGADVARLVGEAKRSVAQCDQHLQLRYAVRRVRQRIAQRANLAAERAQIAAIEFAVGVAEYQRRLRQQRDHSAGDDVRTARNWSFARRV